MEMIRITVHNRKNKHFGQDLNLDQEFNINRMLK
jgi:hypothetical protein